MLFLSLAPLLKELEVFRPNHANRPADLARMTMHPWVKVSPFYDCFDSVCTRLHYGRMTEAAWQPVVRQSDRFFRQVRLMRGLIRLCELLKEEGCRQAARLISLILFTVKLPPDWSYERPVTFFVPTDQAIASALGAEFDRLLDRKRRHALLRNVLGHAVPGTDLTPAAGEVACSTLSGGQISIRVVNGELCVNDSAKVRRDLWSGPYRVCLVDTVLGRDFVAATA